MGEREKKGEEGDGEETERRRVRDLLLTGVAGVITPLHFIPQENPGADLDLTPCCPAPRHHCSVFRQWGAIPGDELCCFLHKFPPSRTPTASYSVLSIKCKSKIDRSTNRSLSSGEQLVPILSLIRPKDHFKGVNNIERKFI